MLLLHPLTTENYGTWSSVKLEKALAAQGLLGKRRDAVV
jgi:hypothetical protein